MFANEKARKILIKYVPTLSMFKLDTIAPVGVIPLKELIKDPLYAPYAKNINQIEKELLALELHD